MKAVFYYKVPSIYEKFIKNYAEGYMDYIVTKDVTVTPEQYDAWVGNLLADFEPIAGLGGCIDGVVQAVRVSAPGRKPLLVDTEGYNYARYIAF